MIAAPRSGSGKTTVTLGLMRALRSQGLKVAGAKSGPDYIDPAFHEAAIGRASLNLDSWAMDPPLLAALAAQAGRDSDLMLVEGSMGLFDGAPAERGRSGASADVAAALGFPVLLVLDVSGQAQSAGAVAKGCALYDPRVENRGRRAEQGRQPAPPQTRGGRRSIGWHSRGRFAAQVHRHRSA